MTKCLLKSSLDLCRVSNLPTVWTNVLAAALLSTETVSWSSVFVLSLSLSAFYSAGMCLNDICDIAEDRVRRQTRPLPSGRMTVKGALIMTVLLFTVALSLLFVSRYRMAVLAGLLLSVFVIFYDLLHKSYSLSVFLMAACRFMVFAVVSIAVSGFMGVPVICAGIVQFLYVLTISVVARHEHTRKRDYSFSAVPLMIAAISLLDGALMAIFVSPYWLLAGAGGMTLTMLGQRYVRGD